MAVPLVVVSGDAGIGKWRLVAECLDRLRADDTVCALGQCLPLAGKLPLLPFVEALRGLGARGRRMADAVPAALRLALNPLVPGVDPATGGDAGWRDAGQWQQQRLFRAVWALLSRAARFDLVVVAIADVFWADESALDLVAHLVAGVPTTTREVR